MKHYNICYSPINDCGGFGGNWFWNHTASPLPNGGNGFGLFCIGNNTAVTNKYEYQTNTVTNCAALLLTSIQNSAAAGNTINSIINTGDHLQYQQIYTRIRTMLLTLGIISQIRLGMEAQLEMFPLVFLLV